MLLTGAIWDCQESISFGRLLQEAQDTLKAGRDGPGVPIGSLKNLRSCSVSGHSKIMCCIDLYAVNMC